MIRRWLAEWLRPSGHVGPAQCRLSEAEALEIGARASSSRLSVLRVTREARGLVWVLGTATIGRGEYVRVDDASGEVIDSGTWGKR